MHTPTHSRFEQAFVFHMIRAFFLLLTVAAVVLAIRYVALRWNFAHEEPERVDAATKQLATDIKSVMSNAGGPTAAPTVYPILERNYSDLGLDIAVLPAAVTVESMKETRNTEVQGLQPRSGPGVHQQGGVSLKVEAYCLACHVKTQVGDVLGLRPCAVTSTARKAPGGSRSGSQPAP